MHLTDVSVGNPGLHPIVGAQLPIGCGVAMALKRLRTDHVCLIDFGDGAVQAGIFHESLNLAALWKLPVVFVCSNNLYAVSVPFAQASCVPNVADRGLAYAMPSKIVDGQNVLAVFEVVKAAIARARRGEGPTLIECKTYRLAGHSQFDPNDGEKYRSREEIDAWRLRDPLLVFRETVQERFAPRAELNELDTAAKHEAEEAAEQAVQDPWPDPVEAFQDIYA